MSFYRLFVTTLLSLLCVAQPLLAQSNNIVLASTTSTDQSGLLAYLLPKFTAQSGISVRVVAVGSGQAIDLARRGDADALLVHDAAAEEKLVAEGFAIERVAVMYNDFVLVGPSSDPAKAKGQKIETALTSIASTNHPFVSRGDKSGTHTAELNLWKSTQPRFSQYRACGCSMGAALNMASAMDAYTLTDRATWASFKNRGQLEIMVQAQEQLKNQYSVLVTNPAKYAHTNIRAARLLSQWLISPVGQKAIEDFKIANESVFFANAEGKP